MFVLISDSAHKRSRHPASRACRRVNAWPWIWQIRDSLTYNTAPISFRFNSSS
jgi:hypothetical protein